MAKPQASTENKGGLAFIRFWEDIGEGCFEQKFIGEEQEFKVVVAASGQQVFLEKGGFFLPFLLFKNIYIFQ